MEVAIEYKTNWEQEIERCKRLCLEVPEPVPHPDHIIVDMQRDEVRIVGPMTEREKAVWDRMHAALIDYKEEIAWSREQLKTEQSPRMRQFHEDGIRHAERILKIASAGVARFKNR